MPLLNTRIEKGGIQSSSRPGHHQTSARHCLGQKCLNSIERVKFQNLNPRVSNLQNLRECTDF